MSRADGSLLIANDINLDVGRLVNSGHIQGSNRVIATTTGDIQNLGGHLDLLGSQSEVNAGEGLLITSGRDLLLGGAKLNGGQYVSLAALDRDVRIDSIVQDEQRQGAGQGREVRWSGESATTRQYGSQVESGGDLAIDAKRDVTLMGSNLKAGGLASIGAKRDIVIATVEERSYLDAQDQGSNKGLFSTKTTTTHDTVVSTTAIGSTIAGQTHFNETAVTMQLKSGYVDAAKGVYNSIQTARDANKTPAAIACWVWPRSTPPPACITPTKADIVAYIEMFYNPVRLHSSLGYRSPNQFE